jgi:hypothetical protein
MVMSRFFCTSLKRYWLSAMIVALGQWVAAPGEAKAACGDYVTIGGRAADGHHSHSIPDTAGSALQTESAPSRQFPCSGPHCRGETPRPFGAPTAPPRIVVTDWAVLSIATAPIPIGSQDAGFEDDLNPPPIVGSSLFRPPR